MSSDSYLYIYIYIKYIHKSILTCHMHIQNKYIKIIYINYVFYINYIFKIKIYIKDIQIYHI